MSRRLFRPYIGKNYAVGLNGKRILVVGASHYCNKTNCPDFYECTDETSKDSSKFNDNCWYNKNFGSGGKLSENTNDEIDNGQPVYYAFADFMSQYIKVDKSYDVWENLAFTNYIQFMLPHYQTEEYDVSESDFDAFLETLNELIPTPDIIIIWGDTVSQPLKRFNKYLIDDGNFSELNITEWYLCHMKSPKDGKKIAIVNSDHPYYWKFCPENLTKFKKYLDMAFEE